MTYSQHLVCTESPKSQFMITMMVSLMMVVTMTTIMTMMIMMMMMMMMVIFGVMIMNILQYDHYHSDVNNVDDNNNYCAQMVMS